MTEHTPGACATNLEAMIVAYGKLWRDVPSTHKAVQARMVLKDRLTHAERKMGIQLALKEYGPPTEHDILTLDHPRSPDTIPDHLIAAAPDLYTEGNQSAVTMREAAKVFRGMDMNTMGIIMDTQAEKQEAAIAKAKEQTP